MTIFYIMYAIWGASELVLNRMMRSGSGDQKQADKKSLGLIWLTVLGSITVAILLTFKVSLPLGREDIIPYAGLLMIIIGVALRLWIIRQLGRMFTVDVTIRKDHQLKTDGPYKHLRHPSYAASYLTFVGFGFSLNNWASLLVVAIPVFLAFRYRIQVEEKVLEEQFGQEYREYKARTNAMIPLVY